MNNCIYCNNKYVRKKEKHPSLPNYKGIQYVQCTKCNKYMSKVIEKDNSEQVKLKTYNNWQYFLLFGGIR